MSSFLSPLFSVYKDGWTPFTYAVKEGHTEVLKLLLECPDNSEPEKLLTKRNKVQYM